MKILITSGGTTEKIDNVRGVTNFSTGRLGAAVAESFAAADPQCEIYYIHGLRAAVPRIPQITPYQIESTADLRKEIIFTLTHSKPAVDVIIHAMAVSDYTISEVRGINGDPLDRRGKISSDEPRLNVTFTPAPKIIAMLRGYAPYAVIVGFKLLDGVTDSELIHAGEQLRVKNDCDFVLANDLCRIDGNRHYGIIIGNSGVAGTYNTKAEIADGIVSAVTQMLKRKVG